MKRHLSGFLLFVLIVLGFSIGFGILRELSEIELVRDEAISVELPKKVPTNRRIDPLVVTLRSIIYDEATTSFTARLDFSWNLKSPPPKFVEYGIGLTTALQPYENDLIRYETVRNPFSSGNRASREIRWVSAPSVIRSVPGEQYAIAQLIAPREIEDTTKLVIREYNYLEGSVPLVIKHRKK